MILSNIIYGLLIVVAIVMIPLRIRARRRTLREIDALRSSFNQDIKELIKKLEPRTVTEKERRANSLEAPLFREHVRQLWNLINRVQLPKSKDAVLLARYLDLTRYPYYHPTKKYLEELRSGMAICDEVYLLHLGEEEEDAWVAAKERQRPLFMKAMQHGKLVATP